MKKDKTILVVDDEEKIVEALKAYLESLGYTVAFAYSGSEALRVFEAVNPDLILLDLMMPGITGEEVCAEIRRKSRVPVIMLTAKVEESDILGGFGLGADDYVSKPFSLKQLAARIEAVLRRVSSDPVPLSDIVSVANGEFIVDAVRYEVRKGGRVVALTPIEMSIVMTMAKYPTKVFTREELIALALGDDYDGYDRAIDSHIKNIRQKIEDDTRNPKYIMTVYGVGYRLGGDSI